MKPTPQGISVNLIVRNCAKTLRDTLESLKDFVRPDLGDEIVVVDTGSNDDGATVSLCREHGCRVLERPDLIGNDMLDLVKRYLPDQVKQLGGDDQFRGGFLRDFSAARQAVADASRNDLIFWIDSDDVLRGGGALRDFAAKYLTQQPEGAVFMAYNYSFDADGHCNTVLWRERIVNRRLYRWRGVCHESLIPADSVQRPMKKIPSQVSSVDHIHFRYHLLSDVRNYAILRNAWDNANRDGEWMDPRWEFYLGNACRGLKRYNESINWYARVLQRSGSIEDRLASALNIAYAHIYFGRHWKAIDWFFQAIKIGPADPRAYFGIARAYFDLKRYQDCIRWTHIGFNQGQPELLNSVDPAAYEFYPRVFEALSLKELGLIEPAVQIAQRVYELRPKFEDARALFGEVQAWANREQIKSAVQAATNLAFSEDAAVDMVHSLKPEIRKQIPELQIETFATPPKKSVTFLCGVAPEPWDMSSLDSGIGGSEKMVLLLSRELARRGYRVDVYGNPKDGNAYKNFDGVCFRPIHAFNPKLPRDIVIGWRHWGYLDLPINAKQIFLDLHDVQTSGEVTPARLSRLKAAIFKSQFHIDPVEYFVGDKGIILRNAIDPTHFTGPAPDRDHNKIVFCSSGDRGLKRALILFAKAKAIRPDLSFHWYYGFTPFYLQKAAQHDYAYMGDEQCDRHMLDYAEECFSLSDRLGAVGHGRIGHADLAQELRSASMLLYPTRFPEISCMAVMEAQAAGCLPIVSNTAALPETTFAGTLCDPDSDDEFVKAIVKVAERGKDLTTYRAETATKALERFNISDLASYWINLFNKD